MSKKSPKDVERRALVEKMRQDQARKEKRRSLLILGACIVVVLGLLTAALIPYLKNEADKNAIKKNPVSKIGATRAAASCDPIKTKSAEGSGDHKAVGTVIDYPDAPPAFGPHWPNFMQGSEIRNFYSRDDRPEMERMVHSLEHGHTYLWYDDSIKEGSAEYKDLEDIATKFSDDPYFNIVPWKSTDGAAFPDGKHVVLTHWTGPDKQTGVWEYCGKPSGVVVDEFTQKYPASNSPEPGAA